MLAPVTSVHARCGMYAESLSPVLDSEGVAPPAVVGAQVALRTGDQPPNDPSTCGRTRHQKSPGVSPLAVRSPSVGTYPVFETVAFTFRSSLLKLCSRWVIWTW
jgi:hypothetical protein